MPVYITYDLHLEFTKQTIESIHKANHTNHDYKIFTVVSYCKTEFKKQLEELTSGQIIKYNDINGVSIAWNTGIKYGVEEKYDYIIIINNDIIFHPDSFDNLVNFADKYDASIWTGAEWKGKDSIESRLAIRDNLKNITYTNDFDEHPHFSFFMMTPQSVSKLKSMEDNTKEPSPGLFDEKFAPAYFEDGDMHQRILRLGLKAYHSAASLFYHWGSRTIKVDENLGVQNNKSYEKNRQYFIYKWGFDPHSRVVENNAKERFKFKEPFEKLKINK